MAFSTYTVVTRAADLVSGLAASLKKIKGAPAALTLTLREKVAEGLGWADGDRLQVQLGDGEHHGLIRMRKDADGSAIVKRRVSGDGQKRGGPYYAIALGHIPAFVDRSEPKKWCTFEVLEGEDEGWIEIVLPSWADETGPAKRNRLALPGPHSMPLREPVHNVTAQIAGDPPPHRSALALTPPRKTPREVLTRGEARRRAEAREEPEMAAAEQEDLQRRVEEVDRIGRIMSTFGLTRQEARLVRALMTAKVSDKEALHRAIYDDDPTGGPEIKIIDVFMVKVRKKLRTALVEIETVWGQGYRMTPENVARLMVLLDGGAPGRAEDEEELESLSEEDEEDAA